MGRLRTNKNAIQILTSNFNFINHPEQYKGKWKNYFGNDNEIEIEIGVGKGDFIINKSLTETNKNFIGIDINSTILLKIEKKIKELHLKNFGFFSENAKNLLNLFEENEISKIYLNFSDPWPKKKHVKRRLTEMSFLKIYEIILKSKGLIHFKTDDENLYNYTLDNLRKINACVNFKNSNLYLQNFNQNDIITEYEKKFLLQGKKIMQIYFHF